MAQESQGLHLEQKQRLRLSQNQLRFVRMLELNAPELDDAVSRELEDNPALEAEETSEEPTEILPKNSYINIRQSEAEPQEFVIPDNSENLYDYLENQAAELTLSSPTREMVGYLIGNIDSNGYLRRPLNLILNDMLINTSIEVPEENGIEALQIIRRMDPAGVGAFDLRDCLRLQLERLPASEEKENALTIINDGFEEFTMKHYHRFRSRFHFSQAQIRNAIKLILSLNPKPGAQFASRDHEPLNIIIPDFIVENHDGELFITLNNHIPELSIQQSFREAVDSLNRNASKQKKEKGSEFIISRYNDARDFIRILKMRQKTMMTVMTAITEIQKQYFLTEDVEKMQPMMIKDIAARTGLDISTISRATNNKYVATGWGIFPLRHFFSDSIGEGDDPLTNRRIEAEIIRLVEHEDKHHPLSDDKLCKALQEKGFEISRRTVAKYRDRKKIPVARLRKLL